MPARIIYIIPSPPLPIHLPLTSLLTEVRGMIMHRIAGRITHRDMAVVNPLVLAINPEPPLLQEHRIVIPAALHIQGPQGVHAHGVYMCVSLHSWTTPAVMHPS